MGSNPTSSARSSRKYLILLHNFDLEFFSHTFGPNSSITRSTVGARSNQKGLDIVETP